MSILRKISVLGMLVVMSILFLAPTYADAATIGKALASPESGWQRYDDSNSFIKYGGTGTWYHSTNANFYLATDTYVNYNTACNESTHNIKFKFYGTKLRIIGQADSASCTQCYIVIDGTTYQFSQGGTSLIQKALNYEITGLNLGLHEIELYSINSANSKYGIILDAIDIDDTGYLADIYQPTNLVATPGNNEINLTWNAVDGAASYNIKRSTTAGGSYETIATSSAINFTDSNVEANTTYYYVVSSVVSDTQSTNSNEASAIIEVAQPANILKVVLEVSEELQLSVDDDLDVNTEMAWTSSNNTVATVDDNGVVSALTPGNTIITVTSADGSYTDYINVLVVENADDYRLAIDLKVGKSCRLTVDDLTDTVKVTWDSSDTSVATISSKGKVTAVSEGLTLITATDEEGNIIGQVYVRVRE